MPVADVAEVAPAVDLHDGDEMVADLSNRRRSQPRVEAVHPGRGAGPHPNPVPYTNLRAHETVLKIVCRLLLEKKKTKETRPM